MPSEGNRSRHVHPKSGEVEAEEVNHKVNNQAIVVAKLAPSRRRRSFLETTVGRVVSRYSLVLCECVLQRVIARLIINFAYVSLYVSVSSVVCTYLTNIGFNTVYCLKKNQSLTHLDLLGIPQSGGKKCQNAYYYRWDQRLQIQKPLFMAYKQVPRWK